jgi:hypothetical protein
MNCDELRDDYELYTLGLADEPERTEIHAHLGRRCAVCTAGVTQSRQLTAVLAYTAPEASPSSQLRKRILASVGSEPLRLRWAAVWAAAAALAVFAAVYIGISERRAVEEVAHLRNEATRRGVELARLDEALAILNGPETLEVSFGEGKPQPPRGRVFVSPARGVLLLASHLSPAPSGKAYEMWVIPKGGKPVPAGLFQSAPDGTAIHVQLGAIDVSATGAVAVTLENDAGATQPTSQPLIVAALAKPA